MRMLPWFTFVNWTNPWISSSLPLKLPVKNRFWISTFGFIFWSACPKNTLFKKTKKDSTINENFMLCKYLLFLHWFVLLLDKEPLNVMSEEKQTKNFKPKISQSNVLIRIIPFLLAFTLRYIPHAFLGNIKVYPEAIPIAVIDDFLSEEKIIEIQNLIKRERRFTTARDQRTKTDRSQTKRFGPWIPNHSCWSFHRRRPGLCQVYGRTRTSERKRKM